MNFCARLVAAAKGGEMIVSEAVRKDVSYEIAAQPRSRELKGYTEPVKAYVARVTPVRSAGIGFFENAIASVTSAGFFTAGPLSPDLAKQQNYSAGLMVKTIRSDETPLI